MIEEKHNTDVKAGGQYPLNEVERASLFCQLVTGIYFHIIYCRYIDSLLFREYKESQSFISQKDLVSSMKHIYVKNS